MNPLDQHLITETRKELPNEAYAGFWPRLGAALLDGVVTIPIGAVIIINMFTWKSMEVLLFFSLLNLLYKPLLEYKYGATVGKMAAGTKVVGRGYAPPTLQEVLLRNVFQFLFIGLTTAESLWIMSLPDYESVSNFIEYSIFLEANSQYDVYFTWVPGLVVLADGIVMVSDPQKRSIHDMIGKTYVVRKRYLPVNTGL